MYQYYIYTVCINISMYQYYIYICIYILKYMWNPHPNKSNCLITCGLGFATNGAGKAPLPQLGPKTKPNNCLHGALKGPIYVIKGIETA